MNDSKGSILENELEAIWRCRLDERGFAPNPEMSLRKQLNDILPALLPNAPGEAIKGTELIRLARRNLDGNYSDASLRYHFSIMSCDPTSAIAKVEQGQGYYRRGEMLPALAEAQELRAWTQGRLDEYGGESGSADVAVLRMRKFRAVITRYFENNGRFPFPFRDVFSENSPIGNLWKFPDLALVDWEMDSTASGDLTLDRRMLALKQKIGVPPFRMHAAALRLSPSLSNFRSDYYQALSVSQWAQGGELIYAGQIEDVALADGLRKLHQKFGVGVTSFGLSSEILDDLPRPSHIQTATPKETEAILSHVTLKRIAVAESRPQLDWDLINGMRSETGEMDRLLGWLLDSMESQRITPLED